MVYRDDPESPTFDGSGTRSRPTTAAEVLEIPQYRDNPSSSPDAGAYDEPNSVGSVGYTSSSRRTSSSRGKLILGACLVAALAIGVFVHSKSGLSDTSVDNANASKPLFKDKKKGVRGNSDVQKEEIVAEINEEMKEVEDVKPVPPAPVPAPAPPAPAPKPEHTTHLPKVFYNNIDECEDDATYVHSNGNTCNGFIAHVGRPALHEARCSQGTGNFDKNGNELLLHHYCKKSCNYCTKEQAAETDAYHEKFLAEQEAMTKANAEKAAAKNAAVAEQKAKVVAEQLAVEQMAVENTVVENEASGKGEAAVIAAEDEEEDGNVQEDKEEEAEQVEDLEIVAQDEKKNEDIHQEEVGSQDDENNEDDEEGDQVEDVDPDEGE